MDADLQDSPEEIPGLYDMIVNGKYDLVSGWKKNVTILLLLKICLLNYLIGRQKTSGVN
jgi:hypothetical protein